MMKTKEMYIVITGASSGIGYETAKAFAKRKKNLILVARRLDKLTELQDQLQSLNPDIHIVCIGMDLEVSDHAYQLYEMLKDYSLECWINNAGFGDYHDVASQDLSKIERMIHLHIETVTILSTLFVRDYQNVEDTQLINVSSCGGYTIVPNAITYCATKFYISAFTEGLSHELKQRNAPMLAKVFAPAAAKTEFGRIANGLSNYDYDKAFPIYHTAEYAAQLLLQLYDSDQPIGLVDRETFAYQLSETILPYAGNSLHNQR